MLVLFFTGAGPVSPHLDEAHDAHRVHVEDRDGVVLVPQDAVREQQRRQRDPPAHGGEQEEDEAEHALEDAEARGDVRRGQR